MIYVASVVHCAMNTFPLIKAIIADDKKDYTNKYLRKLWWHIGRFVVPPPPPLLLIRRWNLCDVIN